MILSADLNSYYIETITDINAIYLQRQEMTRMYHYIIFIILIACLIVSLILSYIASVHYLCQHAILQMGI